MFKFITEETDVAYSSESNLSYYDDGQDTVALFDQGDYLGDCQVWQDSEMDFREYVILNYTIIYLDTIKNSTVK